MNLLEPRVQWIHSLSSCPCRLILLFQRLMDSSCIEIVALGRPLYPGMLYDCRRDSFIPGVTLWDKKVLCEDLDVHQQPQTHLKFAASDTLSDKANLLDISASLKASFYSGLVEVGGSAKYLRDNKSSARQCRVTMQYSQTTKFEQLTMKELGHITYPELEQNPTTYKESLEVYKKLPTLMEQRQNKGVPLNVWLYPLTLLDDKAAKLVREISMRLLDKTEDLLEELGEEERTCNDLIKNLMTNDFPDLKDRLLRFQTLQKNYTRSFQKALSRLLPAIRGGTQEDKALGDILNIHYTSPFTASNMNKWLDDVTTELNLLSSYTSGLKDLTVVKSSGSLSFTLLDHNVDVVICFSFTSLKFEDSYLVTLQDFENLERFTTLDQTSKSHFPLQATQPWFTSPDISASMRQNISLFTSFSKANKNDKRIKFIIASISDPSNPGTSIRLYQKGVLTDPRFQPVSKPPPPVVQTSDKKVHLKLSKSPTGETVQFRVEYRMTPPTDSVDDIDEWIVTDTSDAQTSLSLMGLKPADQHWVRYRAVSDVGVSEASNFVPFTFSEKPNVGMSDATVSVPFSIDPKLSIEVGQSWNLFTSSSLNELRTKIMTSLGMSRWSLSTIKSEVTNVVNSPSNPYAAAIPGGLRAGKALYFQGVVSATGRSFTLDILTGPEGGDIAFHFRPFMEDRICFDSRRNGTWEKQENISCCQISKGSSFDIFIVTQTEGYEVYINGQRFCLFKHRMPVENVTALKIHGDVIINTVGVVPNWNTSTFGKELNSGTSRTKLSDTQSDVPHPVCNPSKPYLASIPGGLRPGMALFFQGVVPSDCQRFEINLQTGPQYLHDIALHFNPRLYSNSVVCNSCRDGKWDGNHIETPGGPFVKGGAFDIIMVVKPEGYEVMVNGLEYCTYNHRIPVDKVTTLGIRGDVFMNTVRIIEKGVLTDPRFQPVSKPPPPVVQTSDKKVHLKLSKSPTGETVQFRVEYRTTPPTDSVDDIDEWIVTDTSDAQTSLSLMGLKPADQHWVRYRAVSDVGVSEASNFVPFTFSEKPNVGMSDATVSVPFSIDPKLSIEVGQSWNLFTSSSLNELRTKIMTSLGMSRWSLSTIKSEVTNVVNSPNWNTSTFGKELNSGTSRTKLSDTQSDVPHPVCNPSKPYLASIPGGLRPGMALFFQGVVPSDCQRFDINLQTGLKYLHDIALHFNPRLYSNSVVCNSCRDGKWDGNYIETPGGPFVKGGAFDIIMVVKPEGYEVMVNGLEYCTYNHRIPVDKVTTLGIRGDVFMNTVRIIEVEDVYLKVTIPANILGIECSPRALEI
ncbi:hypothetical protein AMELA_G00233300 [Ameiurus melas]|uniref:Galectin n=1 Tax=Ameiurus melas TaxID=219545 RepID=A0A7J6A1K1_AMEME|nr:hypothetical protein AMELA_G00233300 [Ameiurus melas]